MRRASLAFLLLTGLPAAATIPAPREYRLKLFNTHSHERLDVVYRRDDVYDPAALAKLDLFLRDRRGGAVKPYDPKLFDLLSDLMAQVDRPGAELHVICGYRTAASNAGLRKRGSGVAKASLHMRAEAIDIRVPGVKTSRLRDTALALARGGVGYYAGSNFVHIDTGRVRRW
ncbi:MAG: DUF882 domain-containing protein [Elusimicrobiota bacterium]|nr:DUF882 domain-containing protein [Elusimicrobiota bacterium]